jgi:hypothetical protein
MFFHESVVDTPVVHLGLQISSRIFEKIRNDHNVFFRGLGENHSCKTLRQKNLVTLFLLETVELARLPAQLAGRWGEMN